MADLKLFINQDANSLIVGLGNSQTRDANSLPFFYGDTINLNIWILKIPSSFNPQDPSNSALTIVPTNGLSLFFYIDDGLIGGTIYTQQIVFNSDATNQYFIGTLALDTAALATLLGTQATASAWIKIGYIANGQKTTVLSQQVTIRVGLPTAAVPSVPAGQTALSAEVAAQTYFPLQPVAGQALYLESVAGKIFVLQIIDNADGTASPQFNPVN